MSENSRFDAYALDNALNEERAEHANTKRQLDEAHIRNITALAELRRIRSSWWFRVGRKLRMCQ